MVLEVGAVRALRHRLPASLGPDDPDGGHDDAVRVGGCLEPQVLAAIAYLAWRFGPTIVRTTGWCSWWVAWACGSQGGYGYCIAFAIFGALVWGAGTVWYAHRRGHWPSALSARLLAPPALQNDAQRPGKSTICSSSARSWSFWPLRLRTLAAKLRS